MIEMAAHNGPEWKAGAFAGPPHSFAGLNEWVGPLRPEVASIPPIKVFRQTSLHE